MAEFDNMLRINRWIKPAKQKTMLTHTNFFYKGLYFLLQRIMDERETHYSFEHNNLLRNTQNIHIPYILP